MSQIVLFAAVNSDLTADFEKLFTLLVTCVLKAIVVNGTILRDTEALCTLRYLRYSINYSFTFLNILIHMYSSMPPFPLPEESCIID